MPDEPSIDAASVIVPARDEAGSLEATLDSLAAQDCAVEYEVLVVAGDERSRTAAREHPAADRVLVDGRADGPGHARNLGAALAGGDLLLFTDADTEVPPAWIRRHRRHYASPDVVGVGGPLRPLPADADPRHSLLFRLLSDWWYRAAWPVGFVQQPGPNCSVRRTAFERVGGFDESLSFIEDTDLSLRLKREGLVVYDHRCPVATSARRQEREGYLGLFGVYARGYLAYAVPGLSPSRDYF